VERAGRDDEARTAFALAARLATSIPEQRYLNSKAKAGRASVRAPGARNGGS